MDTVDIPSDWKMMELGELFEITSSKRIFQRQWKSSGVPFYRARELVELSEKGKVDNELHIDRKLYRKFIRNYGVPKIGDILVTGVGTLGILYVVDDDHEFYFKDGNIIWLKSKKKADSEFISQLFQTRFIQKQIEDSSEGTTVGTYTITAANKTVVPFPPIEEQHAISSVLRDVDNLISSLDQLIEKKRAIKKGAMQQLLTGKKRLQGFRDSWKVWKFEDLFSFLSTANNSRSDLLDDGDYGYIHYGDVHKKWNTTLDLSRDDYPYIDEELINNANILEEGDLIIADASEDIEGIGKSVEVRNVFDRKVIAGLHTFLLRGDKSILSDGFKGYLQFIPSFNEQLRKIATGISVYGISKSKLKKIAIRIPSIPEQKVISDILLSIDEEILIIEKLRDKYKLLKTNLMHELLTGKTRLV